MIQIWQVPSECGPSNLVVLALGTIIQQNRYLSLRAIYFGPIDYDTPYN